MNLLHKQKDAAAQLSSNGGKITKSWIPVFCAYIGHILWGLSYLFIKTALRVSPPNVMLAHRFILATLIMTLLIVFKKGTISFRGKNWKPALLLVAMQLVYYCFESYGILYTNATFAGVVLSVTPVVAIVLALVFLKEYPTKRQAIFCFVPIIGVVIMTIAGSSLGIVKPLGILFLVLTCLSSAIYKTANRKTSAEFSPFERTYLVLAASAIGFTIVGLKEVNGNIGEFFAPMAEPSFLFSVLALSVLCSVGANLLVNYAINHMSVVKFSSFGAITTLCSMFSGVVFLGEPITVSLLIGAALILIGIYQVTRK